MPQDIARIIRVHLVVRAVIQRVQLPEVLVFVLDVISFEM